MKLYVLRLGEVCVDRGSILPGFADGSRLHLPIMSYLIETHDGQALIVDTGMHRGHISGPTRTQFRSRDAKDQPPRASARVSDLRVSMRAEDYLLRQLADLDVAVTDVRYVVNTHFHFDHAGNNELFANARFFIQREHYDIARNNPVFPNEYWNVSGLAYEFIDGDAELFPGIEVISSPGHVPHHQSVLIRLPNTGSMLLCGDAIFCREQLDLEAWGSHADPDIAQATAHRLVDVAEREAATMVFGHDPDQGMSLRRPPFFYD